MFEDIQLQWLCLAAVAAVPAHVCAAVKGLFLPKLAGGQNICLSQKARFEVASVSVYCDRRQCAV